MFIAHLPAGYLLGHVMTKGQRTLRHRWLMLGAMIGSVVPDIDLIYYYTWGQQLTPHHRYFTHMPSFWLFVLLLGLILKRRKNIRLSAITIGLALGGLLHATLDTTVGGIYWLMPFDDSLIRFGVVPRQYDINILNYLLHWHFAFEVVICLSAAWVFIKRWLTKRHRMFKR